MHSKSLLICNCIAICQILIAHSSHLHWNRIFYYSSNNTHTWCNFNWTLIILRGYCLSCHSIWNYIISSYQFLTSLLKDSIIILFIRNLTQSIIVLYSCIFQLPNFMELFKCKQFLLEITMIKIFEILITENTIFL